MIERDHIATAADALDRAWFDGATKDDIWTWAVESLAGSIERAHQRDEARNQLSAMRRQLERVKEDLQRAFEIGVKTRHAIELHDGKAHVIGIRAIADLVAGYSKSNNPEVSP